MGYSTISRPLQLVNRTLQWISAVIVMGLAAYFVHKGPNFTHVVYELVIAVISVVVFIPGFFSPFITSLSKFVLGIDFVFSYLWLTAFVFSATDYSQHACLFSTPAGVRCSRKHADEAFIFLAFIFTFFGIFLEIAAMWTRRNESTTNGTHVEKNVNGRRAPLDAPAEPTAPTAPAGTV